MVTMKKGEMAGVEGRGMDGGLGMESVAEKAESYTVDEPKDSSGYFTN